MSRQYTLQRASISASIDVCGEMADADFGYVGGAPGKVNLYVGKTAVKFNIPEAAAVDRLKDLIREQGKWVDREPQATPSEAVS
jgi:(E)-4-hydroxy-3-methylbut-2-enyl-diphosphate synthase